MGTPDGIQQALAAPFHPDELEWRPGSTTQDKTRALALPYVQARAVMNRLDDVCKIDGWYDSYHTGPAGGVVCRLSLRIGGEWITKEDGAENTDVEGVKGGISDALKRAAVKYGIGRYLYDLPVFWVPCEERGRTVVLKEIPRLPDWALPEELRGTTPPKPEQRQEQQRSAPQGLDLPDVPVVDPTELSRRFLILNIADPVERADHIGWALNMDERGLTTSKKLAEAVQAAVVRDGVTNLDAYLNALFERIKERGKELV